MKKYLTQVALAALGVFLAFLFDDFFKAHSIWRGYPIIGMLIFISFLIANMHDLFLPFMRCYRKLNSIFGRKRVAILDIIPWTEKDFNRSWTNTPPDEWKRLIELHVSSGRKFFIKKVRSLRFLEGYHMVINPYGGVYVENDFFKQSSLLELLSYIRAGGIFVNVADIPGYYAYDVTINRSRDAGTAVYLNDGQPIYFFEDIPMLKRLGLKVRATDKTVKAYIAARAVEITEGVQEYDSFLYEEIDDKGKVKKFSPFFKVHYVKGRAIFSLFDLRDNSEMKNEIVARVIAEFS